MTCASSSEYSWIMCFAKDAVQTACCVCTLSWYLHTHESPQVVSCHPLMKDFSQDFLIADPVRTAHTQSTWITLDIDKTKIGWICPCLSILFFVFVTFHP